MMEMRRVLAVIPARGGSRGLPGKNIRDLAGLPLIGHSVMAARLMPSVTRTIISTDSLEIAEVARSLGAEVPFMRPPELALDETPMPPVLRHALSTIEEQEGRAYDYVILLDPTSPVRRPEQVERGLSLLEERPSWDGLVSVSSPGFHPLWVGVRPDDDEPGRMRRFFADGEGVTRRQDLGAFLRVNGNFYVWRASFIRRPIIAWMDEGVHGMLEIPEHEAFAIDFLYQFQQVEALIRQGFVDLPWLSTTTPKNPGRRTP